MYFAKLDFTYVRLLIHCPAGRSILLVVDVGKKAGEGVKSSEWVMSMWRPLPRCSFAAVAGPRKSMVGAEQPARTTQTWRKTLTTLTLSGRPLCCCLLFLPYIDFHQVRNVSRNDSLLHVKWPICAMRNKAWHAMPERTDADAADAGPGKAELCARDMN